MPHTNKYWFVSHNINSCQQLFLSSVSFAFHVKCGLDHRDFKILCNRLWHEFLSYVKFTFLKTYFNQNTCEKTAEHLGQMIALRLQLASELERTLKIILPAYHWDQSTSHGYTIPLSVPTSCK